MRRSAIMLVALTSVGLTSEVFAQSQTVPIDSNGNPPAGTVAQQLTPGYARAAGSLFSPLNEPSAQAPTGPLSSVGNWLENAGIDFRLPVTEQLMGNPSEGSRPGVIASGNWVNPTLTFDLHKILGIPDAKLRFQDEFRFLKLADGPNNATGFQGASNSGFLGNQHRLTKEPNSLSEASYEQLLLDERLDLEVGRMNLKRYFFTANCDSILLGSCQLNQLTNNANLGPPAFSEWAGRAAWNITPDTYVQVGSQEVDPHGKSTRGFDLGVDQATGYVTLAELAYKTSFAETAYPEFWEFGGYSMHAPHTDPIATKHVIDTSSGIGLDGQKTVWRADGGASNNPAVQHANLYFQSMQGLDETSVYATQISVGGTFYGPIPSRPFDFIGAKVTYMTLTSHEQKFLASQRFAAGGPKSFPSTSYYLELNSHVQLAKGVVLEPVVQYVIDPDTVYNPKVKQAKSGVVLALSVVVGLGELLGLSS